MPSVIAQAAAPPFIPHPMGTAVGAALGNFAQAYMQGKVAAEQFRTDQDLKYQKLKLDMDKVVREARESDDIHAIRELDLKAKTLESKMNQLAYDTMTRLQTEHAPAIHAPMAAASEATGITDPAQLDQLLSGVRPQDLPPIARQMVERAPEMAAVQAARGMTPIAQAVSPAAAPPPSILPQPSSIADLFRQPGLTKEKVRQSGMMGAVMMTPMLRAVYQNLPETERRVDSSLLDSIRRDPEAYSDDVLSNLNVPPTAMPMVKAMRDAAIKGMHVREDKAAWERFSTNMLSNIRENVANINRFEKSLTSKQRELGRLKAPIKYSDETPEEFEERRAEHAGKQDDIRKEIRDLREDIEREKEEKNQHHLILLQGPGILKAEYPTPEDSAEALEEKAARAKSPLEAENFLAAARARRAEQRTGVDSIDSIKDDLRSGSITPEQAAQRYNILKAK